MPKYVRIWHLSLTAHEFQYRVPEQIPRANAADFVRRQFKTSLDADCDRHFVLVECHLFHSPNHDAVFADRCSLCNARRFG